MKLSLRGVIPVFALFITCTAIAAPQSLIWRGDITTANAMVNDMAKAWHKRGHPPMVMQPFSTVSGIDAVAAGTADIAGSARGRAPRRSDEHNLVFTPVAWDALVIITNPRNPVNSLTLKQLHDVFYGKIHNWRELGGEDKPIHVYSVASPTDGITFSLRRLLFGHGNQPVAAPRLYLNVRSLAAAVALDPQSLGASALSNAHANRDVKMLAIDNIRPSSVNVANGTYPLYTPLYLVTRPVSGSSAQGKADATQIATFLAFAQSPEVAGILRRHDLVPYTQATGLAGHDQQRILAIAQKTGRPIYHHGKAASGELVQAAATPKPVAAASSPAVSTAPRVTWYTVVSGDTLSAIARHHAVSVSQLQAWNHIQSDMIYVGQKLAIHTD